MPIDSDEGIREVLSSTRTIALVGASPNPERASHAVMHYMLDRGYRVIPVNPSVKEVLGQKTVASLKENGEPAIASSVWEWDLAMRSSRRLWEGYLEPPTKKRSKR